MNHEGDKKIVFYWNAKKTWTIVCCALLVPVFLVFLISLTFKQTLLNPQYYKDNFVKADTYNRLIQEGIPSVIMQTKISDNAVADAFAKEIGVFIIQKSIDPVWLQNMTNDLVDQIVKFLGDPNKKINLDLSKAQTVLDKTSNGLAIVTQIIPSCSEAQNNALLNQIAGNSLNCDNMSTNLDQIKQYLVNAQKEISAINLGVVEIDKNVQNANSFISNIRQIIDNVNTYYMVSLILMILLILAIILLELRNIPFMIKSISISINIGSLATLLLGLIGKAVVPTSFINNSNLTQTMQDIISSFLRQDIIGVFQKLNTSSGIVLIIFVVIYIATIVLEKTGFKFFGRRD